MVELLWDNKKEMLEEVNSEDFLKPDKYFEYHRDESKNFDTTENLYIEGDNLEALKLLQKDYNNKIKMIYIDPPYNTERKFIYNDTFRNKRKKECRHSGWLNMMYPRLKLARDLLREDGVLFVSIGQEEIINMISVLDLIYGESNRISIISRVTKTSSNNGNFFAPTLDYVLCYAKSVEGLDKFYGEVDDSLYKKIETTGTRAGEKYRDDVALYQASLNDLRPNQKFFIECPDGSKVIPPCSVLDEIMREGDGRWRWSKEKYLSNKELLVFKKTERSPLLDENGDKAKYNVYTKSYLNDRQESGTLPRELWTDFINRKGADLLKKMHIPFDFSKPVELMMYMLKITRCGKEDIILDFFSGSASTAHAVMQVNAEDKGKRKFIMVQLPEECPEKSEARKAGYENICEIGKERIRRAGDKIVEENKDKEGIENLDIGFKVIKIK